MINQQTPIQEPYPGQLYPMFQIGPYIVWAGFAADHLYAILSNGKTYRLDRTVIGKDGLGMDVTGREWTLVAELPL